MDKNLIKTLNSKNISSNPIITKQRIQDVWKSSTKQQKEEAVKLGGYTDTRSFNKARATGFISVRMVVSLSLTFKIDPFYIIARTDTDSECTMDKINTLLEQYGYKDLIEKEYNGPSKKEALSFINSLFEGLTNDNIEIIDNLSNDELLTLLKSYLIRSQIEDESIRLFLIKLLLTRK